MCTQEQKRSYKLLARKDRNVVIRCTELLVYGFAGKARRTRFQGRAIRTRGADQRITLERTRGAAGT